MARSDIIVNLIKAGYSRDISSFTRLVETFIAEEEAKNRHVFADQLRSILRDGASKEKSFYNTTRCDDLVFESIPERQLDSLFLDKITFDLCAEFIHEQHRSELLQSYGLEPRNRILLKGPPGNGKTSLAEALSTELMYPLYTIRYENIIGSYLGETATRLQKVFDYLSTKRCVLFFDEFETLAKERGDTKETGEIKRVVSSLLLQIDRLPSYVVVVTASNHSELLDKAVWRRFQLKLELPKPKQREIELFLKRFMTKSNTEITHTLSYLAGQLNGYNFSEIEDFCLDILRQSILLRGKSSMKKIVSNKLKQLNIRSSNSNVR